MTPLPDPNTIYQLGQHRLAVGSCTDPDLISRLFDGHSADLVVTSPPYWHQRKYLTQISDWDLLMQGAMSTIPHRDNAQVLVNLGLIRRDGELVEYWRGLIDWMREHKYKFADQIIWDKGFGLFGSHHGRLAPAYEIVLQFCRQSRLPNRWVEKRPENIALPTGTGLRGADGSQSGVSSPESCLNTHKIADNVLRVSPHMSRGPQTGGHPAVMPVALADSLIQSYSVEGEIVFDPFGGSGTTLIAAERLGRRCFAVELEPAYCKIILDRVVAETGIEPVRLA
jgi:DNA modification methylase